MNSPMRVTSTKTDAKCSNEFKGSANVSASAGILPYTYLWNNGNTTASATGLPGGNYSVRVTDAGGCGLTSAITINSNKTTNDYSYSTKISIALRFHKIHTSGLVLWRTLRIQEIIR